MRYTSSSISWMTCGSKMLLATFLMVCLHLAIVIPSSMGNEVPNSKVADEDSLQLNEDMSKRDWNQKLQMWGKRGWENIHGGWGLKRSVPSSWSDVPIVEKRSWDNFQGGWGKRNNGPYEDDAAAVQALASILGQDENSDADSYSYHEEEKRNWNKFNGGWGKRSKWDNFRGSWGKRDPAWSNLKGYWGKRSEQY